MIDCLKALSSDNKVVYGENQVIAGKTYSTVIIDYREPEMEDMVKAFVSFERLFPKGLPAGTVTKWEYIEYDYFDQNSGVLERQKIISKLDMTDKSYPQNGMLLISERNYRFFDFGIPVTFPDQPKTR